jgi:hypothetical protein
MTKRNRVSPQWTDDFTPIAPTQAGNKNTHQIRYETNIFDNLNYIYPPTITETAVRNKFICEYMKEDMNTDQLKKFKNFIKSLNGASNIRRQKPTRFLESDEKKNWIDRMQNQVLDFYALHESTDKKLKDTLIESTITLGDKKDYH